METLTAAKTVFVKFLTEMFGENSTTSKTPVAVLGEREVDMNATVTCCLNSGDDRLVPVTRYGTCEVELPEWLSPAEWLRNQVAWKYAWGFGVEKTWPEAWQRFVAYECSGRSTQRLAVVKLLSTKSFRSAFRASLRKQLEAWLATPADERKYGSPFSDRQWDCLCEVHTAREASRLDNQLYWNR